MLRKAPTASEERWINQKGIVLKQTWRKGVLFSSKAFRRSRRIRGWGEDMGRTKRVTGGGRNTAGHTVYFRRVVVKIK